MQPHYPYLSLVGAYTLKDRLKAFIHWRIIDFLGKKYGPKLARKLVGPASYVEMIAKRFGERILKRAYEENLRVVIEHVLQLIRNLHGKIIITSDHGELLGERGMYDHLKGKKVP